MLRLILYTIVFAGATYWTYHYGKATGHINGWNEAKDHYQVILQGHAKHQKLWDELGDM